MTTMLRDPPRGLVVVMTPLPPPPFLDLPMKLTPDIVTRIILRNILRRITIYNTYSEEGSLNVAKHNAPVFDTGR